MSKLYRKIHRWFRYWLVDDVSPSYEPVRFAVRGAIHVILIALALVALGIGAVFLVGCGPECAPAHPTVGNYDATSEVP